jgi:hypothetical protein
MFLRWWKPKCNNKESCESLLKQTDIASFIL